MSNDSSALSFLRRTVERFESGEDAPALMAEARHWIDQLTGEPTPEPVVPHENVPMPRLVKRRGFYCVPMPTPSGRARLISTGCTDLRQAQAVVKEQGVDRLVILARSGAMTADAVVMATTGRKMNCEALLKLWIEDLAITASHSTVAIYRGTAEALFEATGAWAKPLVWITKEQLSVFINADGKLATRQRKRTTISSLYKFARSHGLVIGNLIETVKIRHQDMTWEQKEPKGAIPFTEQEYRLIVNSEKTSLFWKQFVTISWWTGLRISDIAMLETASIHDDCLICWTRKRRHRLKLPFSNPLIGSPELIAVLRELKANPFSEQYCFSESFDFATGTQRVSYLSLLFTRLCVKLGIQFKSFHCLRHAAISRFAAAGMTLEAIGGLVGHRYAGTTQIYVHPPKPVALEPDEAELCP